MHIIQRLKITFDSASQNYMDRLGLYFEATGRKEKNGPTWAFLHISAHCMAQESRKACFPPLAVEEEEDQADNLMALKEKPHGPDAFLSRHRIVLQGFGEECFDEIFHGEEG